MRKIPISGGPHSGKTTLLTTLREAYPDAYFVEEPAEKVITEQLALEEAGQDYVGIFPWNNYKQFAHLVLYAGMHLEAAIPKEADLVFQDRSLIDNIGYNQLNGYGDLIHQTQRMINAANYATAFFCEPVGSYTTTLIRRETPIDAAGTHQYLATAYAESGLNVVHLPAVSVQERIKLIREVVQ